MKDGGVGKGTAGRTALVDMPFRRCSTGTLNGLRCIANRQKKNRNLRRYQKQSVGSIVM
jgi:hypothetical protein